MNKENTRQKVLRSTREGQLGSFGVSIGIVLPSPWQDSITGAVLEEVELKLSLETLGWFNWPGVLNLRDPQKPFWVFVCLWSFAPDCGLMDLKLISKNWLFSENLPPYSRVLLHTYAVASFTSRFLNKWPQAFSLKALYLPASTGM